MKHGGAPMFLHKTVPASVVQRFDAMDHSRFPSRLGDLGEVQVWRGRCHDSVKSSDTTKRSTTQFLKFGESSVEMPCAFTISPARRARPGPNWEPDASAAVMECCVPDHSMRARKAHCPRCTRGRGNRDLPAGRDDPSERV